MRNPTRSDRPRGHRRPTTLTVAAAAALLMIPACSTDEDAAPTTAERPTTVATASADESSSEFCDIAKSINEGSGPPTVEQISAYAAAAPEEIKASAAALEKAFIAADGNAGAIFTDPAVTPELDKLTAFEDEHCDIESGPEQADGVTALDPSAQRVDVIATDYHFETEYPTTAGRYSFAIKNDGEQPHVAILARLEPGTTMEQAMASEGEEGIAEMFESDVLAPGAEGFLTADLTAGNWVFICPIPSPEGPPHAELGMVHEFTVA